MFKSLIQHSPKSPVFTHQSKVPESLRHYLPTAPRLACEVDVVVINFHKPPLTDGSHLNWSSDLMGVPVSPPRQISPSSFPNVDADVRCGTVAEPLNSFKMQIDNPQPPTEVLGGISSHMLLWSPS